MVWQYKKEGQDRGRRTRRRFKFDATGFSRFKFDFLAPIDSQSLTTVTASDLAD